MLKPCDCLASCYHERWQCITIEDSDWKAFYNDWWDTGRFRKATDDHSVGNHILAIQQHSVMEGMMNVDTRGHILLRNEVTDMLRRIKGARRDGANGIVLTGQPGNGKSTTGMALLLSNISEGEISLYSTRVGRTYLFDQYGVFEMDAMSFKISDVPRTRTSVEPEALRIWSIIDSQANPYPPPPFLLSISLFPVYTTSPMESRYKEWRKTTMVHRWLLDTWSIDELLAWVKLWNCVHPHASLATELALLRSSDLVAARASLSGSLETAAACPRDLQKYLLSPLAYRHTIAFALGAEFNTARLTMLLGSSMGQVSHSLITIRRSEARAHEDDEFFVDFGSPYIASQIGERLAVLSEENSVKLFDACQAVSAASNLGGWIFEALVVRYLTTEHSLPDGTTHVLAEMTPSGKKRRYQHLLARDRDEEVLLVRNYRLRVTTSNVAAIAGPSSTFPTLVLAKPRARRIYENLNNVAIVDDAYFYPMQCNNPLFDGFFFDIGISKIILWIVQISITKLHHGSANGYDLVQELHRKAAATGKQVDIQYLLVVPRKRHRKVEWEMPAGWKTRGLSGPVFVQYLDWRCLR